MWVVKYICFVIAIMSTLLFISDIIVDMSSGPFAPPDKNGTSSAMKHAAIRLILSIIMSLTWPLVFLL